MMRRTLLGTLLLGAALLANQAAFAATKVVVGGKDFTEQLLTAELTAQLLTAKGYDVDKRTGLGSAALRQAQESGQIDVYWEYTGTSLITYNKVTEKLDPDATFQKVKELDAKKGLVWLGPSKANDTYALAMRKEDADAAGLKTLSDLAAKVNGGAVEKLACNAEFYARPDGLAPMEKAYGFKFGRDNIVRMDSGLVYQSLRDKQVQVALVFATDGRIPAFDFVVLKDDKQYFPNYALAPVVRTAVLDANPQLAAPLNALAAALDDAAMARMNAAVDVDKKTIESVATDFLKAQKLM